MTPTPGRTVLLTMKDGSDRPLIVTHAFGDPSNMVNGHLLLDGENDRKNDPYGDIPDSVPTAPLTRWATSIMEGTTPGTWHWPVINK